MISNRTKNLFIVVSKIIFFFILAVGLLAVYLSATKKKEEFKSCSKCNVIFISIDTLRAGNTHFLGYKRKTTPFLDDFAKKSFIFENAFSVTSWTLPSTMSWFTSMYPSSHKVLNKFTFLGKENRVITNLKQASPKAQTLAEILKKQGYLTGGFTGGAGVDHQFGFDQGFNVYTDDKNFGGFNNSLPKALSWITKNRSNKFFVFLHGYDVHGQYVPESGYDHRFVDFSYKGRLTGSKEEQLSLKEQGIYEGKVYLTKDDVRFLTALYDEKIQKADSLLGKFIKQYSDLGLLEKTIFVITSDHGEELYDHGRIDHGHSLYDELTHVPLLIYIPKTRKVERIKSQVRSIDLMPTILELVGIKSGKSLSEQMAGKSLTPLLNGGSMRLNVFQETDYLFLAKLRSIRTPDNWKLIVDFKSKINELYNLNKDKKENQNIVKKSKKFSELDELLQNYLRALNYNNLSYE